MTTRSTTPRNSVRRMGDRLRRLAGRSRIDAPAAPERPAGSGATDDATEGRIRSVVAHALGLDPEDLRPETLLRDDLAMDEVDVQGLCVGLGTEFGIALPPRAIDDAQTYGGLVDAVLRQMGA
jgi:acyl carrier protein